MAAELHGSGEGEKFLQSVIQRKAPKFDLYFLNEYF